MNANRLFATVIVFTGLVLAAAGLYVGWELPHQKECSGDACTSTFPIDWSRVDWGIPPQRYACGVAHPEEDDVLIGPGDVCVTSSGANRTEVTYEELRARAAQRRVLTLVAIAAVLGVTAVGAVAVLRRRPAGSAAPPHTTSASFPASAD